jgi:hypothetical protein
MRSSLQHPVIVEVINPQQLWRAWIHRAEFGGHKVNRNRAVPKMRQIITPLLTVDV